MTRPKEELEKEELEIDEEKLFENGMKSEMLLSPKSSKILTGIVSIAFLFASSGTPINRFCYQGFQYNIFGFCMFKVIRKDIIPSVFPILLSR